MIVDSPSYLLISYVRYSTTKKSPTSGDEVAPTAARHGTKRLFRSVETIARAIPQSIKHGAVWKVQLDLQAAGLAMEIAQD